MARVVLITGGGGAIALQIALRLAERGDTLLLVDVDHSRLTANSAQLRSGTRLFVADLSSVDDIEALAAEIETDAIAVDLLVNCAGYMEPGPISDVTPDVLYRHIMINLTAAMRLV